MPCKRVTDDEDGESPRTHSLGPMGGLSGLDIWWRPVWTEDEKIEVRFKAAVESGLLSKNREEFTQACKAGFANKSTISKQNVIVCSYLAARHASKVRDGDTLSLKDYLLDWVDGLLAPESMYEKDHKRCKRLSRELLPSFGGFDCPLKSSFEYPFTLDYPLITQC